MECAGQDRGSRYRTAHNFLLEGNSCMDQERHSEVLSPLSANSLALLGSFTDSYYLICALFVIHFLMHLHDNSTFSYFSMHASSHLFAHLLIINLTITSHPSVQSSERARHVQAWEYVQKALVIGKQLKDWTIQSNALRGAVVALLMCCDHRCHSNNQPFVISLAAFRISCA